MIVLGYKDWTDYFHPISSSGRNRSGDIFTRLLISTRPFSTQIATCCKLIKLPVIQHSIPPHLNDQFTGRFFIVDETIILLMTLDARRGNKIRFLRA
jgi:hypothetical protein